MATTQLKSEDLKQAGEELKKVRAMIKVLEKAGVDVPSSLTRSLRVLQIAIETEKNFGEAFEEASDSLATVVKDLELACGKIDGMVDDVCSSKVQRQYLIRSVNFTLNWKNPDSVTSKFLKKTVQSIVPTKICQHWSYCAKQAKKK